MIKLIEIINSPGLTPKMVEDLYTKLYHSGLGDEAYKIAYTHNANVYGDSLFISDFSQEQLKSLYSELLKLEKSIPG